MLSAITVANFFVNKGLENNDTDMTPMKVLKLTYIAYGWYLALFDKKLFNEPIQAWQYGPVVPIVYSAFKNYRNQQVTSPFLNGEDISLPEVINFLNKVWEVYKNYSGWQLSSITHQPDTPWFRTWNNIPNAIISDDIIKAHYDNLAGKS